MQSLKKNKKRDPFVEEPYISKCVCVCIINPLLISKGIRKYMFSENSLGGTLLVSS